MIKRSIILTFLASSLFMAVGCSPQTQPATQVSTQPSVAASLSVMADATQAKTSTVSAKKEKRGFNKGCQMSDELKTKYPELVTALESLKGLTPDQMKAKMDELKAKYPDAFKNFGPHQGGFPLSAELKAKYPELVTALEALKGLTPDQMKVKMDELKAKYPDAFKNFGPHQGGFPLSAELKAKYPELVTALESLKDLTPEQMKAKMVELKAKYPDAFKFDKNGFNKGFNKGCQLSVELKAKYPELVTALEALKDLTPEQRKTKMDELKAKYPDAFPQRPTKQTIK